MQKIVFTKMCGAGNDFLITDSLSMSPNWESVSSFIKDNISQLCDRKFGLGADGVCLLSPSPDNTSLDWQFFNNDGSAPDMCGNAACCIIEYTYRKKLVSSNTIKFQIKDKILIGEIKNQKPWLQTECPVLVKKNISETIQNKVIPMDLLNSGVPHLLIQTPDIQKTSELRVIAQTLRKKYSDTNITFYHPIDKDKVSCISYERGVEDFTLACGTGALAVAFKINPQNTSSIQMPGGTLTVSFENQKGYLNSPIHWIGRMTPFLNNKPS